jgi:hypothetical protein
MNATYATPQTPTTISIDCPWCAEPVGLDDAFATNAVRCGSCATTVDVEPVGALAARRSVEIAA